MKTGDSISLLSQLGNNLSEQLKNGFGNNLNNAISQSMIHNPWFTRENILCRLKDFANMPREEKCAKWLSRYERKISEGKSKKIGVVMAGNIPAVGFHDFLCVLVSGNIFIGKLSSQDKFLLPALAGEIINIMPSLKKRIFFEEGTLKDFDAIIATGSDNSSRYFEYYFGRYPHIIRKNRNSAAILTGDESPAELKRLADDIFMYFGLGCRNITKLYVPEGCDFSPLKKAMFTYSEKLKMHNKYMNNYNYHKSVFLINSEPHIDTEFCLLKEDASIPSPIAVLHYEFYKNIDSVIKQIAENSDKIQCVVSSEKIIKESIPFGKTQSPELWDYADGVDTLEFLSHL